MSSTTRVYSTFLPSAFLCSCTISGQTNDPVVLQAQKLNAVGKVEFGFVQVTEFRRRFESLTPREQEVISMVVCGMLNKQISGQLGTSENTVKVHRSRAMEKMRARSLPDLVRSDRFVIQEGRSATRIARCK